MPVPVPADNRSAKDYRDRYEALTGPSLRQCPACRQGQMLIIETFERVTGRPPYQDTMKQGVAFVVISIAPARLEAKTEPVQRKCAGPGSAAR